MTRRWVFHATDHWLTHRVEKHRELHSQSNKWMCVYGEKKGDFVRKDNRRRKRYIFIFVSMNSICPNHLKFILFFYWHVARTIPFVCKYVRRGTIEFGTFFSFVADTRASHVVLDDLQKKAQQMLMCGLCAVSMWQANHLSILGVISLSLAWWWVSMESPSSNMSVNCLMADFRHLPNRCVVVVVAR